MVHHDNRQGAFRGSSAIFETSPDKVFHNFRALQSWVELDPSMRLVWRQKELFASSRGLALSKVQKSAKLILSGRPQYAHARTRQLGSYGSRPGGSSINRQQGRAGSHDASLNQSVMAKSVKSNRFGLPFVSTISTP